MYICSQDRRDYKINTSRPTTLFKIQYINNEIKIYIY